MLLGANFTLICIVLMILVAYVLYGFGDIKLDIFLLQRHLNQSAAYGRFCVRLIRTETRNRAKLGLSSLQMLPQTGRSHALTRDGPRTGPVPSFNITAGELLTDTLSAVRMNVGLFWRNVWAYLTNVDLLDKRRTERRWMACKYHVHTSSDKLLLDSDKAKHVSSVRRLSHSGSVVFNVLDGKTVPVPTNAPSGPNDHVCPECGRITRNRSTKEIQIKARNGDETPHFGLTESPFLKDSNTQEASQWFQSTPVFCSGCLRCTGELFWTVYALWISRIWAGRKLVYHRTHRYCREESHQTSVAHSDGFIQFIFSSVPFLLASVLNVIGSRTKLHLQL